MKVSIFILLLVELSACNSDGTQSVTSINPKAPSSTGEISNIPGGAPTPAPVGNGVGLVWNGTGACTDGCAAAGAAAVTSAGLTVRYVNQNTLASNAEQIAAVFENAKVWVMPGGYAYNEVASIPAGIKSALLNFISTGGGYVGWCAGAFAATASIGTIGKAGLGIFPGNTRVYNTSGKQNSYGASIEKLTWFNDTHYFYLEGGPYLTNLPSNVEIVGRYDDQVSVAAARTTYGSGRVYLSGVHPEAPTWWWTGTSVTDADGSDEAYAAQMVKWAAKLE